MAITSFPSRLAEGSAAVVFSLWSARVRKSTWVRTDLGEARRIDLLDEAVYQSYLARPGRFADELRAVPAGASSASTKSSGAALLNEVHRFIEEHRMRFILCGSSARKLKQQGTNLLAGRAHDATSPVSPAELGQDFDLDRR